jgi:hypothetical protein
MTSLTVWHDGACPLCRREIALMRRLDRRGAISFVDASDPAEGCPANRDALLARFHAQENGRAMVSGAAAFAAMWRAIPLLRPVGTGGTQPGGARRTGAGLSRVPSYPAQVAGRCAEDDTSVVKLVQQTLQLWR